MAPRQALCHNNNDHCRPQQHIRALLVGPAIAFGAPMTKRGALVQLDGRGYGPTKDGLHVPRVEALPPVGYAAVRHALRPRLNLWRVKLYIIYDQPFQSVLILRRLVLRRIDEISQDYNLTTEDQLNSRLCLRKTCE